MQLPRPVTARRTPFAWVGPVRRWIKTGRGVVDRLATARISIIPIGIGATLLLLPQGADVVRGLADDTNVPDPSASSLIGSLPFYVQWAMFLAASVGSGVNAWYWPRLLSRSDMPGERLWFTWLRRTLGLAPLGVGFATIWSTAPDGPTSAWAGLLAFAVSGAALLWFFCVRRHRYSRPRYAGRWFNRPSRLLAPLRARLGGSFDGELTLGDDSFFVATVGFGLVMLLLLSVPGWCRTHLAWFVGSAGLAFGAIGAMIAMTSALIWLAAGLRLPIVTMGIACFVVFSFWNDNHAIRTIGAPGGFVDTRLHVADALIRWEQDNPSGPLILVATAGGASRAAYWTGAVLRALDDRTGGHFSSNVFAISSVSGGTLGAVGYSAWVADQRASGAGCAYDAGARRVFDRAFLGGDYLAPAVAGLMYPDLVQRFLPIPFRFVDRARALEDGWEIGWRGAAATQGANCSARQGSDRMAQDFLRIWKDSMDKPGGGWVPIVLANGTVVESGKRIITAPVRIEPGIFEDAYDFYDLARSGIRASTAVTNSARFPIVSPAGTIKDGNGSRGRIVDGGYFENGGLETVYDLARYLSHRPELAARPILIVEINNDDTTAGDEGMKADLARYPNHVDRPGPLAIRAAPTTGAPWLSEITSIIGGLYHTRDGRGVLGAKRISGLQAVGLGARTYRASFDLGPLIHRRRVAMSWSLSLSSRDAMDGALNGEGGEGLDHAASGRTPLNVDSQRSIRCERMAADEIATVIDGGARAPDPACLTHGTYRQSYVGVPLFADLPPSTPLKFGAPGEGRHPSIAYDTTRVL